MGLATNDTNNKDVPTQGLGLVGLGSLSSISAGRMHACGIQTATGTFFRFSLFALRSFALRSSILSRV
jgi:hypothetical protein